jgi:7,8-dihydroneopterin aldolase/epimerase/oxygenase
MITVALHGAEFFAYHGFYPEEQVLGNKFIIDIEVTFPPKGNFKEDNIQNTVDYEKLHKIAAAKMKQTKKLIETVAQSIADKIKEKYPFAESIKVSIKKCNPPMNGRVAYSSIVITV